MAKKAVSDDFRTFSDKLKNLMKARNKKQQDLADVLGVKRQTISLYMNGQSKPDAEQLKIIAQFFNVSADWLLGLSDAQSVDKDIRAVCDATGINQDIVRHLIEWNKAEYSDDEVDPILEFNTLFGNPGRLWTLMLCVYANSINFDMLGYIEKKVAEERENCYSEETGWERPERAKDLLMEILELKKEIRYTRFEAIDTFTSIFDDVQETKHLESEIDCLLEQFKGVKLDEEV